MTDRAVALLDRMIAEGGCVPLALAKATGRTLDDVADVIGDLPFTRGHWWMFHADKLGLDVGEPIVLPNLRAARQLPPGAYLIDSTDHLEAVTVPDERVRGRWKHGAMTAYRMGKGRK